MNETSIFTERLSHIATRLQTETSTQTATAAEFFVKSVMPWLKSVAGKLQHKMMSRLSVVLCRTNGVIVLIMIIKQLDVRLCQYVQDQKDVFV